MVLVVTPLLLGVVLLAVAGDAASHSLEAWGSTFAMHAPLPLDAEARFQSSLARIDALQERHSGASFAPGPFALMTQDEWRAWRRGGHPLRRPLNQSALPPIRFTPAEIAAARATAVDWQSAQNRAGAGAVTRVRNQGNCGSCFAFAVGGALEGAWRVAGRALSALSVQFLLDCVRGPQLDGCDGGSVEVLAEILVRGGGISVPLERDYEYTSYDGSAPGRCRAGVPGVATAAAAYYVDTSEPGTASIEDAMMAFLHLVGPLTVLVDSSGAAWQHYAGGLLPCPSDTAPSEVDHAVLLVGYGVTSSGIPYWRIKNSWAPLWGEQDAEWGGGYARLRRGVNACGIGYAPIGFRSSE